MLNNPALEVAVNSVKSHLEEYLVSQKIHLDPATKKFKCINPEHKDNTPSSFIVPESDGQVGHCFGCSTSFTIFHAANWIEGLPKTGPGWLNTTMPALCKRFEITLPTIELTPEQKELLEAQKAYQEAGQIIKYSTVDKTVPQFEERGWDNGIGVKYGIGFVNSYAGFIRQLKNAGYDEPYLERIGLRRGDIFNENSMIFNIHNHHGQVIGFAARNLKYTLEGALANPQDATRAKYINSSSDTPLYRKREVLYGLHVAKIPAIKQGLILVEGYADWIALQEAGIKNVAAVCGTALTKEHLHLLSALDITKITLCLDNDNGGNLGTIRILDDIIGDNPSISVDVLTLPEGVKDPDQYLRAFDKENKAKAWSNLKSISCFEYRLIRFPTDTRAEDIANKMVPLIVTEPNAIIRERMIKELAKKTDIRVSAIQKEVDRMSSLEEYKNSEQVASIVGAAVKDLTKDPTSARETLSHYLSIVEQMHQSSSLDLVGPEEVLTSFTHAVTEWSKVKSGKTLGIPTHISNIDTATNGLQEGRVIGLGGKANHGKSAFVLNIAHKVATLNSDTLVIIHSTDDNRDVVFSRLMAIDQGLEINCITDPRKNLLLKQPIIKDGETIRWDLVGTAKYKQAKENIGKLISDGRIVVKDSTHGATLAFTESMIKHYKEKNPDKRILVIFDNFHRAQDFLQHEERIRFKKMSNQCKYMAEKYHVALLCTMEYTKIPAGQRPANSNLAESVSMEYDLSMVMHLYNELIDIGPERAKLYTRIDDGAESKEIPIVEVRVGKNKQTAIQGNMYYNFYPEIGRYEETTGDAVKNAINQGNDKRLEGLK